MRVDVTFSFVVPFQDIEQENNMTYRKGAPVRDLHYDLMANQCKISYSKKPIERHQPVGIFP